MWRFLCVAAVAVGVSFAADANPKHRSTRKFWLASVAALAGASVLDAHSSWGKRELNPLLRGSDGRFGARGLAIKSSLTGGCVLLQWLLLRRDGEGEKAAAVINSAIAAGLTAAAIRNLRINAPLAEPGTDRAPLQAAPPVRGALLLQTGAR
jgi:hypothetical protein